MDYRVFNVHTDVVVVIVAFHSPARIGGRRLNHSFLACAFSF